MATEPLFREYLAAVLRGDTANAARLARHFPARGGILAAASLSLFFVAPLVLITHGANWPRTAIVIFAASIPVWITTAVVVWLNGSADDDDGGGS